ncbi:MAG: tyrosine-type recombinase/integrase, partial [Candidatus Nanohaloarchaea archaeon]
FSPKTVNNIYLSVRRFFIWYKADMLGMEKEEFIQYKYPSTHLVGAGEPEYTAEYLCSKSRQEIENLIFVGEDRFGLLNAEKCLEYEKEHKNRDTVKGYFQDKLGAEKKMDYVEVTKQDVKELGRIHISRFIDYLQDEKQVKAATARKYTNSLKHFVKFYSHPDYCPIREDIDFEYGAIKDSLEDFENSHSKNKDLGGKTLTPEQVGGLIEACQDRKEKSMALLLVKTGLRREELTNIKMEDLHLEENWIYVRHRKGGKTGNVIFDEEAKNELKVYLKSKRFDQPEDYLFTHGRGKKFTPDTITRKYKAWAKHAGIPEDEYRGPHDLRHTFANHHRKEVRNTEEGNRVFRRLQMSHAGAFSTGEHYDFDPNPSDQRPVRERFEDYKASIPKYLDIQISP